MESTSEEGTVQEQPTMDGSNPKKDTKATKDVKVGTVNLYEDKVASLLHGLTLSSCQPDADLTELHGFNDTVSSLEQAPDGSQVYTVSSKMMCSLCDSKFDNREQQTEHYKLDWHRFNLKQRLVGAKPVTMETFEDMSGDISSISGSDSNSSDSDSEEHLSPYSDQGKLNKLQNQTKSTNDKDDEDDKVKIKRRSYPKVFFTNSQGQLISVHRCILHGKKNIPKSQSDITYMAMKLASKPKWAIIMTGGGHFAGAVFHGKEMVVHKTFHRYTVRAKRGTAQGMRDGQQGGKQPKSAGASLRRYNEAALMQDIQDLLESWKDTLNDCQLIFLRAPSFNRGIFYGGKNPAFKKDDIRMSTIPFPTRRATLKELQRIHEVLSSVECYGDAAEAETRLNKTFQNTKIDKSPSKSSGDKKKTDNNSGVPPEEYSEKQENIGEKTAAETNCELIESDDDDDLEVELVYEEQEISTSHLKEFECTMKPRKKKKKRKPKLNEIDFGEEKQLINDLYTACKTGNVSKLEALVNEMITTYSAKESVKEETVCSDCPSAKAKKNEDQDSLSGNSNLDTKSLAKSNNTQSGPTQHSEEEFRTKASASESQASTNTGVILVETSTTNEDQIDQTVYANSQKEEICDHGDLENSSSKVIDKGQTFESVSSVLNSAIDVKGTTLLHVATEAGQRKVLWKLLESGADPSIKNKRGHPPYVAATNKENRNVFRRFMAAFPDKYDYATAQIPSPLTADMEEERSNKAAEKKKAQRKARKEKQKEQKEEQKKKTAEEKEKVWFASMSDREKRALAAETRLAKQVTTSKQNRPRCWLCGEDMTGKVPFEYLDFRFCSMKCLKQHKQKQTSPQL